MTAGLVVVTLLTALLTSLPAAAQPTGKKLPRVAFVFSTTPVAEMLGPTRRTPARGPSSTPFATAAGSMGRRS